MSAKIRYVHALLAILYYDFFIFGLQLRCPDENNPPKAVHIYQSPNSFLIRSLTSLNPPTRLTRPGLAGPANSPPSLDLALGLGLVGGPVEKAGTLTSAPEVVCEPGEGEGG
jgi:hypothetical protein